MRSGFSILRRSLPAALGGALVLAASVAAAPKAESLTAQQILERMVEVYAGATSYHDSGVVKTLFITPRGDRTDEKPFSTAFIRPDRFRFEYREVFGRASLFTFRSSRSPIRTTYSLLSPAAASASACW